MVALQHFLDLAIEAFDHTVCLGVLWRGQVVFNTKIGSEQIELMLPHRGAFAQTEETVGEFLSVVGQNRPDPDWAGPFQIAQKAAGIGGGLGFKNPDEHTAGCLNNRHEQIAALARIPQLT